MSILSKICVVVLTVASLVAMVVIIQLATVEPNFKHLYQQEKNKVRLAEQKATALSDANVRVNAALQEALQAKFAKAQELNKANQTLVSENSTLKLRQAELEGRLNDVNSKLTALKSGVELQASTTKLLNEKLEAAWDRENKLRQETIRLGEQVKEEQAKSFRLDRTVKVLREQVEEFRQNLATKNQEIADLRKGGPTASAGQGADDNETVATGQKIMGAIDAVQNNLASVNIGSANGVKTGMKLIIYRGSKFVGYLKVEEVRLSSAAGIILDKQMAPQAGDKVISNLN